MEKVTGIGGLFFRASNPSKHAKWYEEHLGVSPVPTSYEQQPWMQAAGPTVLAPFEHDTDYFGSGSQNWMIHFRINDLSKLVEQLRMAVIEVSLDDQAQPNGRFARIHDPEGNPIELWEP